MKSQTLPLFLSQFISIAIFLLIFSLETSRADFEEFAKCNQSYQCGDIKEIRYPFWGDNLPQYCGHHGFELSCLENESLVINIAQQRFRVLKIDQEAYTMKLARLDLWNDICPSNRDFVNTTLDYALFDYRPTVRNLSILYDCPDPGSKILPRNSFKCKINGRECFGYFVKEPFVVSESLDSETCDANIVVPVLLDARDELFEGNMTLHQALNLGFDVQYNTDRRACSLCEGSGGICGSNLTSLKFLCLCHHQVYEKTCPLSSAFDNNVLTDPPSKRRKLKSEIVFVLTGIVLTCVIIFCLKLMLSSYKRMKDWNNRTKNDPKVETFIESYKFFAPKRYSYVEVKKMTDSFKDKLGSGGYGIVYKGKLKDGSFVAVKLLNTSKGCAEEFINEVASISRTSHVNVVSLLGFCSEGCKRALIFEYMPNGSLEKFIYGRSPSKDGRDLEWEKLFQIAVGIARGLEYLHRGCNTRILHFDIKPHNILLDEDFCPKISDFGLAKLCPRKESVITMSDARGTIGYIAPEIFSRNFGEVSHKSDVYSYGMMVLEMVGGRKNVDVGAENASEIYFPHWVFKRLQQGDDLGLKDVMSSEEHEIARKMILVGLWCIQTNPSQRPSMKRVMDMLESTTEALQIPPKPFLSPPPLIKLDSCTSSMSS